MSRGNLALLLLLLAGLACPGCDRGASGAVSGEAQSQPAPAPAPEPPPPSAAPAAAGSALQVPRLDLKIEEADFKKLARKRRDALQAGMLVTSRGDYVPATLTHDDQPVNVKIRLKGDWTDHLAGKKLSFRVKVRDDAAVLRMRVFSLQHPGTRLYTNEWQFLEHLRSEQVLAPRYEFVRLTVNGDDWGLYALEEHFSKELLESQQRREGVIVKYDESDFWERAALDFDAHGWSLLPDDFDGSPIRPFRRKKTARSPALSSDRDAALSLLEGFGTGVLPAHEVFKVDPLARFLAVSELWSAQHGIRWHNLRFYYDPLTARLEPIGFDAEPAAPLAHFVVMREPWSRRALADPVLAEAFVRELLRISQPASLEALRSAQEPGLVARVALLRGEFPQFESFGFSAIEKKADLVRRKLALSGIVHGVAWRDDERPTRLKVRLTNRANLPIEVLGFARTKDAEPEPLADGPLGLLPRLNAGDGAPRVVDLPWPAQTAPPWGVVARIVGTLEPRRVALQWMGAAPGVRALPEAPQMSAVLSAHGFLRDDGAGGLTAGPGSFDVEGDLSLPTGVGLTLVAGTTLRFEPGAALIASGPLMLQGQPDGPVHLTASAESFGGVFVANAPRSVWTHARVSKTRGIQRDGFRTTGGVTFYASPLSVRHGHFEHSLGEDALNVIRTKVLIEDTRFEDAAFDAFDGDWVHAEIRGSTFSNIRGDGMDVSGSTLTVVDVHASHIADKALSAGEESRVEARGLVIEDCGFGVASKDLSSVVVDGAVVRRTRVAWAAFRKKHEFGPAHIEARNVTLQEVEARTLCQLDSSVEIEGVQSTCRDFTTLPSVGLAPADEPGGTPPPPKGR